MQGLEIKSSLFYFYFMRPAIYIITALIIGATMKDVLAQSQDRTPVDPTSATDQKVKIHNTRKIFRFHRKFRAEERSTEGRAITTNKRYMVQARAPEGRVTSANRRYSSKTHSSEHAGKSVPRSSRNASGGEARTFRRHSSGVAKNAERVRRSNRRRLLE